MQQWNHVIVPKNWPYNLELQFQSPVHHYIKSQETNYIIQYDNSSLQKFKLPPLYKYIDNSFLCLRPSKVSQILILKEEFRYYNTMVSEKEPNGRANLIFLFGNAFLL